jgi:hypothetical protein
VVQFRDDAVNLGRGGPALRTMNFPSVLHVARVKSAPEIREVFADLGPVAGKSSDEFGA